MSADDVDIIEMLDAVGSRGPTIKLYKDGEPERSMHVWNKSEKIVAANDNDPIWAIEAAQGAGWTVVYHHEKYDPPERLAEVLDAESPPHDRLENKRPAQDFDDGHPCQQKARLLRTGDEVLFNDRNRPLTVVGQHQRRNSSTRYRDVADYHTVVELEGNGTVYHLLCTPGSSSGPMLYKEADWDENKSGDYGQSPRYSRMGERVESVEVTNRSLGLTAETEGSDDE